MLYRNFRLLVDEPFHVIKRTAAYHLVRIKPLLEKSSDKLEVTPENQQDLLKTAIAPLWDMPYVDQLKLKDDWISYVVSTYFTLLKEEYVRVKKAPPSLLKPKIKSICPSPILHHYRSKDVYMVRPGIDGNPKTVGHIVGSIATGKYVCVPPVDLLSPPRHVQVANVFQEYIRSSELPACSHFSDGGNWTQIQVRSNQKGDTMALVKIHPQNLTRAQIEQECKNLKEFFEMGPGSTCQLSSLYFQASPFSNASGKLAPYQLLFGQEHIRESLSGRQFALSPGSFFQSNLKVAEIMYEQIFSSANLSPLTSLLDLGCGIGTISILASPFVRGTVGIDMCDEAIQDAKLNSRLNNIYSTNFVTGLIEHQVKEALELLQPSSDIVAILNPGRCGVDVSVMRALRDIPQIGRIIYVSCQPDHEWVIRNVHALIKPPGRKSRAEPFTFKSAQPVDMFPLTSHCELIMRFQR